MINSFVKLMKSEGIQDNVLRTFTAYYDKLVKGENFMIASEDINPPSATNLIEYDTIKEHQKPDILKHIAVIKLNGGLGTSMGLSSAKSLLPVKGNMNFLDIIVRQVLTLNAASGYDVQLMFMNSFATEEDTLKYLERYPDILKQKLPVSFVQNKFPRILKDGFGVYQAKEAYKSWNPPGHGDIYTAITKDNILEKLISAGYRYAFVSNSDNLGATIDTSIPVYMEDNNVPFLMEVCHRTAMDRKGGHLCEDKNGQLLLREIAQCAEDDLDQFQNVEYYRYFNTNNLWIDLKALEWHLISNDGLMLLPLIANPKVVDGSPVIQLETAMGAAISVFSQSKALVVPRQRFAPVKMTNDLLSIWSDAHELNDQYQIQLKRGLDKAPNIDLDKEFYGSIDMLLRRFEEGVPSLSGCKELVVKGDVTFGKDVICEGRVHISAKSPVKVSNRLLTGEVTY